MRVVVLGGDGFCGWPASLHLSNLGHDVLIADNLSRRSIDRELGTDSLTPISSIQTRLEAWEQISGRQLGYQHLDVAGDYEGLLQLLRRCKPDAVVHLAKLPSAPYSMKSARHKRHTVDNNLNATHNLLCAIVESGLDVHVVHLGSMGVYGYGGLGVDIPEGYLNVRIANGDGRWVEREILHPTSPGSIYHLTKTQDQLFFAYYNKNDEIRITDLHQGIVWGTNIPETLRDERLINRFSYDGDYGTVLNRFLVQAAVGHPLTVHGTGGQTRAFIHIQDTVRCIALALDHPPARGDRVRIFNQMTETHRIRDLARMVAEITGAEISRLANPRVEAEENELLAQNKCLLELGLEPVRLSVALMQEVTQIAVRYRARCDFSKIPATSRWRQESPVRPSLASDRARAGDLRVAR